MTDIPSQDATPDGDAVEEGAGWLDATWVVLSARALPGLPGRARRGERRFVLLHPAHGMAILDTWSAWSAARTLSNEGIAASLDAELILEGFLRRFDPRLPVRRIHLAQSELPRLAGVVARSYAGTPRLALPPSWMDAVRSTLAVPQPPTYRVEPAIPPRRIARRSRLAAGVAALVAAGAVGLLNADGDDAARRGSTAPIVAETAVPEPAPFLAARPSTAGAQPAPETAVLTPPSMGAGRTLGHADPLQGATPGSTGSSPAAVQNSARVFTAAAVERAADGPTAIAPQRMGRSRRIARPTSSSRYTQGWMPNSSGSFIRQQSLQYATANGG